MKTRCCNSRIWRPWAILVKNKALYEDRSPINFVDQIKAPLYLLAGGNDPRCPKEEAQQVVDAVKKRGGVAEYKVYENEGHGFSKVENQIDAYKRVADFLRRMCRRRIAGAPSTATMAAFRPR